MIESNNTDALFSSLLEKSAPILKADDSAFIVEAYNLVLKNIASTELLEETLGVCHIAVDEINLSGKALVSILLFSVYDSVQECLADSSKPFSVKIGTIMQGLQKVKKIDTSNTRLGSENLLKLILTQADDVRVILISLAEKLYALRNISSLPDSDQTELCRELRVLYAPLAHRLGLYNIKTEMEETAMKYLDNEIYRNIASNLNENKAKREAYIETFINPIKEQLEAKGVSFEIKGRPKSIHSIWNKLKKNQGSFDQIYDLFAIRVIIDCPVDQEKSECWSVYSIVSDIYRPNPKRLRDWISAPKNSGYESLHITVVGPESKWVEVQIRTKRMDEIAEKGHAAHWRYKEGSKAVGSTSWLGKIREVLESSNNYALEEESTSRIDLYSDELFVFTPTGDLVKLKQGATLLDFAFGLHTNLGFTCTGGKVNDKVATLKQPLQNGDRVEIFTSKNQSPKQDWLNFTVTSKARSKIKKHLRESEFAEAENGKELLTRKLNQLKVKFGDESLFKMVKHFGVKNSLELYMLAAEDKIETAELRDLFFETEKPDTEKKPQQINPSDFEDKVNAKLSEDSENLLVIDNSISNLDYSLAKCCNPIRGDKIFGFTSVSKGIKIHRVSCPNAPELQNRYPYRILKAQWTESEGKQFFNVSIRITGVDEIGIISTITDVISKNLKVNMRNLVVDTNDGNFEAEISLYITNNKHLDKLLENLRTTKGVHSAVRISG